jgi:hypothetical protein
MTLARRRALIDFAQRHDIAIVEDDYDSEFRHSDRPLEPLQRLDPQGRVIYVGTFAKTMSPTLRLGFAVLPESLVAAAAGWRERTGRQPPTLLQHAMHRFITNGCLDAHLRRARKAYTARHRIVTAFVDTCIRDGLLAAGPTNHAGLHLSAHLPPGVAEAPLNARARSQAVALTHFGSSTIDPREQESLLIGFGLTPARQLPDALDRLHPLLREASTGQRQPCDAPVCHGLGLLLCGRGSGPGCSGPGRSHRPQPPPRSAPPPAHPTIGAGVCPGHPRRLTSCPPRGPPHAAHSPARRSDRLYWASGWSKT